MSGSFRLGPGLTEAHKTVFVPPGLRWLLVDRLTHGCICNPLGAVVPDGAEYRVACDFMETDDLGEDAEVAYRLVQVKLVCHGGDLLGKSIVCLSVITY